MTVRRWKKTLKRWWPVFVAAKVREAVRRCLHSVEDEWLLQKVVTLPAAGPERGRALFSYRIEGFVLPPGDPLLKKHTNYWQSLQMARTLADLGYAVDVIDYRNRTFEPEARYAVFVDVRKNMERLSLSLGPDCLKIYHIDTAHLLANNAGEAIRLLELLQRRGMTLPARRFEQPSRGIEFADCATGNAGDFAVSTHAYAGKPIYPLPAPVAQTCDWPEKKDWAQCRKRFLWLGSGGLVHKGLDLVLEAFAQTPDCHLTVCAPLDKDLEFERAFHNELHETPNVDAVGWIDLESGQFRKIVESCGSLVYPSCSEGLSTSTIECMHAGLIPIVSRETGVPVGNFGFELEHCSVGEIRQIVQSVACMPARELKARSRHAWEYARANHTREKFASVYREIMMKVLAEHGLAYNSAEILSHPPRKNAELSVSAARRGRC